MRVAFVTPPFHGEREEVSYASLRQNANVQEVHVKYKLCSAMMVFIVCQALMGQAQYQILWSFSGAKTGDGAQPVANLVMDASGNLYGTTRLGGTAVSGFCASIGCGTVFQLSPNKVGGWTETILYSFCSDYSNNQCIDGANPQAGLLLDSKGNLYGTTNGGGPGCPLATAGCGTVFELSPPLNPSGNWNETILYNFCTNYSDQRCLDGAMPLGQLIFDANGKLYGTTSAGGTGGQVGAGTVFALSPSPNEWKETILYNFCSHGHDNACPDGAKPMAGVAFDMSGNLYGTTQQGGSKNLEGTGVLYKLVPSQAGWTETVLLAGFEAASPVGNVSFDVLGRLYSTFQLGGPANAGGVFRYAPGLGHSEFWFSGNNGSMPGAGVLVDSRNASLYGSTYAGGTARGGTVFKITAPANETILYNFCSQANCVDGAGPSGVISDKSRNLYGTAKVGGDNNLGVVFQITSGAPQKKRSNSDPTVRFLLSGGVD